MEITTSHYSEDGNRFARAMGGDTMGDEQAAAIVGMDLSIYDVD